MSQGEKICCSKLEWENEEARGHVFVTGARGPLLVVSLLFASVSLNSFAESLADCDGQVLGGSVKASSVLATLAIFEGVANLSLTPFMGAFSDLTKYRREALLYSFILMVIIAFIQCVLYFPHPSDRLDPNEDPADMVFLPEPIFRKDFVLVLILLFSLLQAVTYEALSLMTMAYIPELSKDPIEVTEYVGRGYFLFSSMQVTVAVVVVGIGLVFGLSDFDQLIIASGGGAFVAIGLFKPGFKRLGSRHEIPEGLSRRACGLHHICSSIYESMTKYTQLRLLFISWAFASAGGTSLISLATAYLQFVLGFSGGTVSLMLSLALIMTIPGAALSSKVVKRYDLRIAYFGLNTIFTLSFLLAPFILQANEVEARKDGNITLTRFGNCNTATLNEDELETLNKANVEASRIVLVLTIGFVSLWGAMLGASLVMVNSFFAALIPAGSESAYYGMKVMFERSASYIPPLMFTAINESTDGVSQYAIMSIAPFFFVASVIAYFIDFEKGRDEMSETLHLRRVKHNLTSDEESDIKLQQSVTDDNEENESQLSEMKNGAN